jgi:hypothetical protein
LVLSLAVFAACKTSQVSSHEGAAVTPAPSAKSVPSAKPATSSPAVTADTALLAEATCGVEALERLAANYEAEADCAKLKAIQAEAAKSPPISNVAVSRVVDGDAALSARRQNASERIAAKAQRCAKR